MLVLSRQRDETIMIGDDISVTIVDIRGEKVRLGIEAPKNVAVHRKEVYDAIKRENRERVKGQPGTTTVDWCDEVAASKLVGVVQPMQQLTDEQWWDAQVKNYPQVKSVNGGWTVAVAPTKLTLAAGKTFMEAVHRCRELAARIART